MAIDKNLVSGSNTLLLLKLLNEKEMYGYEMIETLRIRSNNVFAMKAGTLYPILHSLEKKDYVTSYEKEVLGKTRKYYKITNSGKKQLSTKEEEWKQYANAVETVLGGRCYGQG